MNIKSLVDSNPFNEFVKKQPDSRPIDHTGGWSSCAIGDYLKEELGLDLGNIQISRNYIGDKRLPVYIINDDYLERQLSITLTAKINYPTYGDLKQVIKKNLVANWFRKLKAKIKAVKP